MSKLIKFNTRSEFEDFVKTNSGLDNLEDALSSENNGVYGSVVYIADTGEIWANNQINTPGQGGDSEVPSLDDYALKTDLDTKVDKVEGMGLSSNDYTTEDKNKLAGLENYNDSAVLEAIADKQDVISDLDAIRSGAAAGATAIQSIPDTYATKQYVEDNEQITYGVVNHGTSDTSYSVTPNVFHVWGTVTSLTITLATPTDSSIMNEYLFQFTSGSTATSLSTPSTVVWVSEPSIEANKTYQVSIVNNIGIIASVDA